MKAAKQKYTLFSAKALALLIIPLCIESALSSSLGIVDSLMVKDIGEYGNAMSAVANVDQVSNLIIQLFAAFGVGGSVICSQSLGGNKIDEANKSAKQLFVLMLTASVAVMALCLGLNHQIVNVSFGGDNDNEQYLNFAYTYFYVNAGSFPLIAISTCSAALLRAQRKSVNTMVSGAISFGLNVAFNAVFIYACKLEILGAALATLMARAFSAVFLLVWLCNKHNVVRLKLFEKFRFDGGMLKKIIRLALPSGVENSLFQFGKLLVISFITVEIYWNSGINDHNTANTIAYNINSLSSMIGSGINLAIIPVVGQAVGRGDIGQVKHYIKKMMSISYIGNTVCVGLTMACAPLLIAFFGENITPDAAQIAQNCLWLCLSAQFVFYPLSFGLPAVLKANSDMKYVMAVAVTSMALMRVGLCYILTCGWVGARLGAMGLWIGMVSDWALRSLLFGGRLISGRWKKSSGLLREEPLEEAAASDGEE